MVREAIGSRIKSLRDDKNITREDLASELGLSSQRLYRMESGEADISYETICKVADILDVPAAKITEAAEGIQPLSTMFLGSGGKEWNSRCRELFAVMDAAYVHRSLYLRTKR